MQAIDTVLNLFALRDADKETYKALSFGGAIGASTLALRVQVSRTSIYDILDRLIDAGLVLQTLTGTVKTFSVQPLEKLQLLLKEKQEATEAALNTLDQLKRERLTGDVSTPPRLQLYEGRPALQQMMKDMLLYRDLTVYAFWPVERITRLLTPRFVEAFHKERIARNIMINVIWPTAQTSKIQNQSFLASSAQQQREARIAPTGMDPKLGYAIYGNTVRFISSEAENFGFLVESAELAQTMKSQFQFIWEHSAPIGSTGKKFKKF